MVLKGSSMMEPKKFLMITLKKFHSDGTKKVAK